VQGGRRPAFCLDPAGTKPLVPVNGVFSMSPIRTALLLLLLWSTIGRAAAIAQESATDIASAASAAGTVLDPTLKVALTPEFLETKIKEVEAATNLDDAVKTKLTEQYRAALSDLEEAGALEIKASAYKQAVEAAPAEAKAIREALAARAAKAPADLEELPKHASVADIEQRLAKTQADVSAVDAKLAELEKELEVSNTRPAEAHQAIDEAKKDLEALEAEMQLAPPQGETQVLTDARRLASEAHRQSLRSEILMLDQELLSQGARVELLRAARDKAAEDLQDLKETAARLTERLNAMRKAQAQQVRLEAAKSEREASGRHPLVQGLAQRNAALSDELTALIEALDRIAGVREKIEEDTQRIGEDFRVARQRLEAAGLTQALGQVLIDQRSQLPDLRRYRKAASEREDAIAEATLSQIRYSEEQRRLRDPNVYIEELVRGQVTGAERDEVTAQLRELVKQRNHLIDQVLSTDESYLRALGELDYASSKLMKVVEDYDDFLAERLLWVRSSPLVNQETLSTLPKALLWAVSPANWLEVAQVLLYGMAHRPLLWVFLLTGVLLQWKARAMRRGIRATAEHLRRVRTDNIRYTLEALGLTLLVAAPLPLLLATLGWQLYTSLDATDFTKAIGRGAISVSLGAYYLLAFRFLCITGGAADRHFRWNGEILALLRRNFDWLLAVLVPLGFVASAAYNHPDATYSGSLGRLSLIALTLGLALFFARVLDPKRGAAKNLIVEQSEGLLNRLRRLWYPLVVATPLALAVLTGVGYLYTVGVLLGALLSSMYLVLGITVVQQLIVRWLVLTRRRLAFQAALERRNARALDKAGQTGESGVAPSRIEESEEVDYASLDEQTRDLVTMLLFIGGAVALGAIWAQVVPAFGIFKEIALWHYTGVVDGQERIIPVTLADIGLALLIAFVATVAVKNLPALLEILLLSRMSLSAGSRYAIKTLTGYVIAAIAALIAFSSLGLSWGQVQWLVAALSVGMGFGLQEIVANFISGIIILFERPVRVGDIVTIGDTTGSVSRIKIRATTIRNWDKQELLVPNKEFITGRLLNWSLSDTLNRVVITVGVDYGSDIPLAIRLLREVVKENEQVLVDPEPMVTFEGFGDNALELVVRCYLAALDNRLSVTSALHQSINEKFQAAGISIAFPQRDVHLSTAQPLDVRIHRVWPEAAEPLPPRSVGRETRQSSAGS